MSRIEVETKKALEFFKRISQIGDVGLPFKIYSDENKLKVLFITLSSKYDLDLELLKANANSNEFIEDENITLIIPSPKKLVKFLEVLKEIDDITILEFINTDYRILKTSDRKNKTTFYTLLAEDEEFEFKPVNLNVIKELKVLEFELTKKNIVSLLKVVKTIDGDECKFVIDEENNSYFEIGSVLSSEFSRFYLENEDVNFEELKEIFTEDETEYVKITTDVENEDKELILINLNKQELENILGVLKEINNNETIKFSILKNGLLTFVNSSLDTKIALMPEINSL